MSRDPYPYSKPTRSHRSLVGWWRSWWPWSVILDLRAQLVVKDTYLSRLEARLADAERSATVLRRALWRGTEGETPAPEWMVRGLSDEARTHLRQLLTEQEQNVGGGE